MKSVMKKRYDHFKVADGQYSMASDHFIALFQFKF